MECKPETLDDLFQIAVDRFNDLKSDYEEGNESPYRFADGHLEKDLRGMLAKELKRSANECYTVAQEHELANGQKPDICLMDIKNRGLVPIELKIASNTEWTGPKLRKKLRNQLCDYLRDKSSRYGIFLLASRDSERRWENRAEDLVGLEDFVKDLQEYTDQLISEDPEIKARGITDIKVIGIDFTKRGEDLGRLGEVVSFS